MYLFIFPMSINYQLIRNYTYWKPIDYIEHFLFKLVLLLLFDDKSSKVFIFC